MTVIATASNPRFRVSRVDIDRGGPTYTIDTLSDLRADLPDADLYFITGADALRTSSAGAPPTSCSTSRTSWAAPGPATPWTRHARGHAARPRHDRGDPGAGDLLDRLPRPHARGEPVWYLVPDGVVQYISKHRLYLSDRPSAPEALAGPTSPTHRPHHPAGSL